MIGFTRPGNLYTNMQNTSYRVQIHSNIAEIPKNQWNALVENNQPFLQYDFLYGLEKHQCVSEKFGWIPHHIAVYDLQDTLVAALPLYEKHNNYGEFVFDQSWEQAWNQVGLAYYPKLVSATPYTPVLGQRFLVKTFQEHPQAIEQQEALTTLLFDNMTHYCEKNSMSGAHILFAKPNQQAWLAQQQNQHPQHLYIRHDCQFHWHNQNYRCFDDFLAQLKPKKRKNIRQERKAIAQTGISYRILDGHQATQKDWQDFDYFYQKTFIEKWSTPTLNLAFFKHIGETLADNIVLVLADLNGQCIAGALMFKSDTHLYGRHWGASQTVKNLHFEVCFYQGIEYAIKHNLQVFEPGAGGEHKIARGFSPVAMQSSHWLTINPFVQAMDDFILQEQQVVNDYIEDCIAHSPYKDLPTNEP